MAPEEGQYTIAVNKDKSIHGDIRNCIYVSSLYKTLAYYVCTCLVLTDKS